MNIMLASGVVFASDFNIPDIRQELSAISVPKAGFKRMEFTSKNRQSTVRHDMALIPAGTFFMGSPKGEYRKDEQPRHQVYLGDYYIDKTEVTFAQYNEFCKRTGRVKPSASHIWSGSAQPVLNVSWYDAKAYCEWAGKRLPTEAEWEKAARGGTYTTFSHGEDAIDLGDYAWYYANANSLTHPVGYKKPNQYGLYDMSGNSWEWVADWYNENYYQDSPTKNPKGPNRGMYRVLRGGYWNSSDTDLRPASRGGDYPDYRDNGYGFRCAASARP